MTTSFNWEKISQTAYLLVTQGDYSAAEALLNKWLGEIKKFASFDQRRIWTLETLAWCKQKRGDRIGASASHKELIKVYKKSLLEKAQPHTPTCEHHNVYGEWSIADPYHWLEKQESAEVDHWLAEQAEYTQAFLKTISGQAFLRDKLWQMYDLLPHQFPQRAGARSFLWKRPPGKIKSALYRLRRGGYSPLLILDPNEYPKHISVNNVQLSKNGQYVFYTIEDAGEWATCYLKETTRGRTLPDQLKYLKYPQIQWNSDNNGFFYSALSQDEKESGWRWKVFFHKLRTHQHEDQLVYASTQDEKVSLDIYLTDDDRCLVINVKKQGECYARVYVKLLNKKNTPVLELFAKADFGYYCLGSIKNDLLFLTDFNANNGRVIRVNPRTPSVIKEVLPEDKFVLESIYRFRQRWLACYRDQGASKLKELSTKGNFVRDIPLPPYSRVRPIENGPKDTLIYTRESYVTPPTLYKYDWKTGHSSACQRIRKISNPKYYETKLVSYLGKDGTPTHMYLAYKKGLKTNSNNPTILTGYGGFHRAVIPHFNYHTLAWLDLGGIFAEPAIRGGSDYGPNWHEEGSRHKKHNTFDDFIAAAEWLISNNYTCPAKLGIVGASNGGLCVAAALNQCPELFGAAVIKSGLHDMLRFSRIEGARKDMGEWYISEYGCPDNSDDFKVLLSYSPLHNVQKNHYPPTLVIAGKNDERVSPVHSYKYFAALQAAQTGAASILLLPEPKVGHASSDSSAFAQLCFLVHSLKVSLPIC